MILIKLTVLAILHFLAGFSIVRNFGIERNTQKITGSILVGMCIHTIGVYVLGVLNLTISETVVISTTVLVTLISIGIGIKPYIQELKKMAGSFKITLKPAELITFGFVGYILYITFWKVTTMPPNSYDSITGIDFIAKFSFLEGKIANSAFDPEIIRQPNYQACYAPFTAFIQIIYRAFGFTLGPTWLFTLVLSGSVFIYSKLCEKTHYAFSGLLLILMFITPELFSYTFILQTDYTNAVFVVIGVIFFTEYWDTSKKNKLHLSIVFFAVACFVRTETIVFLPFGCLMLLFKKEGSLKERFLNAVWFLGVPLIIFVLWSIIFLKIWVAEPTTIANQIVFTNYGKIGDFVNKMWEFTFNEGYWGYFFFILLAVMVISFIQGFKLKGYIPFIWIVIILVSFLLLKIHINAFNIEATYRRGLFKVILIGIYFMSQLELFRRLTTFLNNLEGNSTKQVEESE